MKRTLRARKDLDDEPDPAWVTETDPRIPTCVKCKAKVPGAKTLHTMCLRCLGGGDGRMIHHDVHALIRMVIEKLDEDKVETLVKQFGKHASDDRVRYHAERLIARGLEGDVAYRQAEAMVANAAHLEHCSSCKNQVYGGRYDGRDVALKVLPLPAVGG